MNYQVKILFCSTEIQKLCYSIEVIKHQHLNIKLIHKTKEPFLNLFYFKNFTDSSSSYCLNKRSLSKLKLMTNYKNCERLSNSAFLSI